MRAEKKWTIDLLFIRYGVTTQKNVKKGFREERSQAGVKVL
jgi:hypothetical protein